MINCEKIEGIKRKWKEAREEAREHCLTQERALVEAQIDHLFDIIKAVADYWHVFYEDPETPTPDTIDVFREAEDKLKKVLMHLIQLDELATAILEGDPNHIQEECADVANYAMMIADLAKKESPMKVWMVQNKELPEDTYFYQATSEEDALDQHAQMAGYADFSEALEYNPGVEFNVRPIEKHEYVELDVVNHLIKMRDNLANDVFRVSHELSQMKEELHAKIRDLRMQIRTCHDENKRLREALDLLRNSVNEFKTLSYEKGLASALIQSGLSDALAQANTALEAVSK